MTRPELRAQIHLTDAYCLLCPTEEDKRHIRKVISEMRIAREPHTAVCRTIAAGIFDGLAYGNWPSTIAMRDEPRS